MKHSFVLFGVSILCGLAPALSFSQEKPPVAPVKPVTENLYGIPVTDQYRYMENLDDPNVQNWMKSQADYTRKVLDQIPGRKDMLEEIEKYVNAPPASVHDLQRCYGGRYFFMKTLSGQSLGKLYMRQGVDGKDVLLVDTDKFTGPAGEPPAINYYQPSYDGKFVAFGVSQGGSEMATIHILDVDAQKESSETIDRAEFGGVNWRPDNHSFFYNRLQKLAPNQSPEDKYRNSKIYLHQIGDSPDKDTAVFGADLSAAVSVAPDDNPFVLTMPGCDYAVGDVAHGVQLEQTLYVAPLKTLGQPNTPWVKLCDVDSQVTNFNFIGNTVYLMTHLDTPRYKIVCGPLDKPDPAHFQTFLPQTPGVVKSFNISSDAIYVVELDDGVDHILRVPFDGSGERKIPLPFDGSVEIFPSDPRDAGIIFELTGWTKGPRFCQYDPNSDKITVTDIRPPGPYDNLDELTSVEVEAPSYDGTMVPLSIVYNKNIKLDGTNPTILWGYGAYGMTEDPGFSGTWLAWSRHGGIFADAHLRGGGERGEEWHLAGYKLTKPNTWRDMIACGQYLIDKKYTSSPKLAILGGSAGGITVGRALTERPDLFAVAIPMVGCLNTLRAEFSPNGPPNIPEFGSVSTQEGFEDLYAMDSLHHVRDGVAYPAVLLTTGMNDPRVASWEPAKMTARLQAATSSKKPILLRIDYQGGHGIGASKQQAMEEYADTFAFSLWQFGDPKFQPKQ